MATARPGNLVEDEGLLEKVWIASNDCTYVVFSRATNVTKIHNLHEDENAKAEEVLGQTNTVAPTGDCWIFLSNQLPQGHRTLFWPSGGTLVSFFDCYKSRVQCAHLLSLAGPGCRVMFSAFLSLQNVHEDTPDSRYQRCGLLQGWKSYICPNNKTLKTIPLRYIYISIPMKHYIAHHWVSFHCTDVGFLYVLDTKEYSRFSLSVVSHIVTSNIGSVSALNFHIRASYSQNISVTSYYIQIISASKSSFHLTSL